MATQDLEKLVVQMSAEFRGYQNQMAKISGITARSMRKIEKRAADMDRRLSNVGRNAFRGLLYSSTALGSALSVREVARYADAWTGAKNSLSVAGVVGEKQVGVLNSLFDAAQKNSAPITALADLFGKAAQANDNLGQSQESLLDFTEGVATSLKVEGKSAQQASGALTQLGQLLGQARVQAEEFNSINEGARPILIAVANGLDEAGGSVSRLKQLVNDGKVSGRQFFEAFQRGLPTIEKMAENATQTIAQGYTRINNALTRYIGETDESWSASQRLVAGLNALADNFDQTADTVLALAGVIAGALVGRSLTGMIRTLGLSGAALVRFAAAVRTATSVSGLATAFGGLSAAAGPIGLLLGGTVAIALMEYSKRSAEAKAQTELVNAELKRLGLISEDIAPKVDGVTEAIDDLTDGERYRKIKSLADEYDRLSKTGEGFFGWFRDDDTLGGVIDKAKELTHQFERGSVDLNAVFGIQDMARDLERGRVGFQDVINRMREIRATEVSQPVADLAYQVEQTAQKLQSLEGAKAASEVNDLNRELQQARDSLLDFSQAMPISLDQREAIADIIDDFDGTKEGAAEARRALQEMADANPDAAGYVAKLAPIFGMLQKLVDKSREFMTLLDTVNVSQSGDLSERQVSAYTGYSDARREGEAMLQVGEAYAAQLDRENSLTKEALALENEKAKIRKQLEADGGFLPDDRIEQLARSSLEANERRNASGKSAGGGGDDEYTSAIEMMMQRKAALEAETAAQASLNPFVDDYGYALEKARASHDLLVQAEKAGLEITPALRADIERLADGYATAAAEAEKAAASNYRLYQSIDDVKQTGKDAMGGFISDLVAGESAADALGNALGRIGDKLLDLSLNTLFGTGPGIGDFLTALSGLGRANGGAVHAARGGRIDATGGGKLTGPGGPRGDRIPAWLSDGEHVINARAARANRPLLEAINSGKALKLADGGLVGRFRMPTLPSMQGVRQAGTANTAINLGGVNITMPEGTNASDAQAVGAEVSRQLDKFSRFVLPGRIQEIQRNPNRVG
ncbi:tape measure protein [Martelella mangrovi]|uniref:Tape measure domain-containing protein n=1 Tax=Martelella mangrovi TaxID=1397477 RepID=A0ABV2IGU1_9HYPH